MTEKRKRCCKITDASCDVACAVKKQVLFVGRVAKTALIRRGVSLFFVAPIASVHAFSDAAMNELRERKKATNLFLFCVSFPLHYVPFHFAFDIVFHMLVLIGFVASIL